MGVHKLEVIVDTHLRQLSKSCSSVNVNIRGERMMTVKTQHKKC